jgi:hypothetical protein
MDVSDLGILLEVAHKMRVIVSAEEAREILAPSSSTNTSCTLPAHAKPGLLQEGVRMLQLPVAAGEAPPDSTTSQLVEAGARVVGGAPPHNISSTRQLVTVSTVSFV